MESVDPLNGLRPAKRARSLETAFATDVALSQKQQNEDGGFSLLSLPDGVLYHVLSGLPASSLMALSSVCRYFRSCDTASGLSLTHRLAKEALVKMVGEKQAARWRGYNWIQRLAIEETVTLFDFDRARTHAFDFKTQDVSGTAITEIRLNEPGPRMLLSDMATDQSPVLRWKLQLRGNNAVEFGVVPVDMQDSPKALHKCQPNRAEERATGISSAITVGSLLPLRTPVMRGTVVEILATPAELAFIVTNPEDGAEMIWQNNSTISRPYKGPRELRHQIPYNYNTPVKLAVTAWQRAAFEVLHTLPPSPAAKATAAPTVAANAAGTGPAAAAAAAAGNGRGPGALAAANAAAMPAAAIHQNAQNP